MISMNISFKNGNSINLMLDLKVIYIEEV